MTESNVGSRGGHAPISSKTVGLVILGAVAWATLSILVWVVSSFILGGGPTGVNLIVLGLVAWGPIFGGLAAAVDIGALLLLRWIAGLRVSAVIAALSGWLVAFGAWVALVNPEELDPVAFAITGAVALGGAVLTALTCWPGKDRRIEPATS